MSSIMRRRRGLIWPIGSLLSEGWVWITRILSDGSHRRRRQHLIPRQRFRSIRTWDGRAPSAAAWQGAAEALRERARSTIAGAAERARREREAMIARQHEAARLRLIEE